GVPSRSVVRGTGKFAYNDSAASGGDRSPFRFPVAPLLPYRKPPRASRSLDRRARLRAIHVADPAGRVGGYSLVVDDRAARADGRVAGTAWPPGNPRVDWIDHGGRAFPIYVRRPRPGVYGSRLGGVRRSFPTRPGAGTLGHACPSNRRPAA